MDGADVEQLPALEGLSLHGFCWDHALAFGPLGAEGRQPQRVAAHGDALLVADTSNNRVLVVDDLGATLAAEPQGGAADAALGQHDLDGCGENRWETVAADTLCWPYGLAVHDDLLAIADSGNNRVMLWRLPR